MDGSGRVARHAKKECIWLASGQTCARLIGSRHATRERASDWLTYLSGDIRNATKGKFLYTAVSSPQDRSKRFTVYFPDRPVHSDTISASLGSIQPYATINARWLRVHISTSIYSQVLIYTAELEQCRVTKLAQSFNTVAPDSNPGPFSRQSEALPLSHCAATSTSIVFVTSPYDNRVTAM